MEAERHNTMVNHQVRQVVIPAMTVHYVTLMMMGDGFNVMPVTLGIIANIPYDSATDTFDWKCPNVF